MSISKCARASSIMANAEKGKYVKNSKFHNFGSVIEDSIIAQQQWADMRLKEIQAQRQVRRVGA